jgi:hypothetical protein
MKEMEEKVKSDLVEQVGEDRFIPAYIWRDLTNEEILKSLDVALNVLLTRKLTPADKLDVLELAKHLISIVEKS